MRRLQRVGHDRARPIRLQSHSAQPTGGGRGLAAVRDGRDRDPDERRLSRGALEAVQAQLFVGVAAQAAAQSRGGAVPVGAPVVVTSVPVTAKLTGPGPKVRCASCAYLIVGAPSKARKVSAPPPRTWTLRAVMSWKSDRRAPVAVL